MIEQRQFQSFSGRAPWATFGLAPLLALAAAYFVACFILWSGWKIFLPGADTPFGVRMRGLDNIYFQADKFFYYFAPILVGWGVGVVAFRQRFKALWPSVGLVLIALMGGAAQISAGRTTVPSGFGHIAMNFTHGFSPQSISSSLSHALGILAISGVPWLILRLQTSRASTI